jgi:hypothetical protein
LRREFHLSAGKQAILMVVVTPYDINFSKSAIRLEWVCESKRPCKRTPFSPSTFVQKCRCCR